MRALFLLVTLFLFTLCGGELYGTIEIGGKGVKAYLIDIEGENAKILSRKSINTAPQSGIDATHHLSSEMIQTITQDITTLRATFNVDAHHTFIVASSALNKITNKDDLKASLQNATKLPLHFIDEYEESLYGFYGSVPTLAWNDALLIDIGGGNTKFGWLDETQAFRFAEIPLGTVSLTTKALNDGHSHTYHDNCVNAITPYEQTLKTIPHKAHIYTIGGIFWATSSFKEGGTINHDEPLTLEDFLTIANTYENFTTQCSEASTQKECVVLHYYGAQNLTAGALLAHAMLKPFEHNASILFVKDGSWMVGWLLKNRH